MYNVLIAFALALPLPHFGPLRKLPRPVFPRRPVLKRVEPAEPRPVRKPVRNTVRRLSEPPAGRAFCPDGNCGAPRRPLRRLLGR